MMNLVENISPVFSNLRSSIPTLVVEDETSYTWKQKLYGVA